MPESDGLDLADAIRSLGLPSPPRVVLLSSAGGGKAEARSRGTAVDGVLTKPIKPVALFELLVGVLTESGASRGATAPIHPPIDGTLGARNPLRVLVAEDNAVNQKVALALLARLGYRADVAGDGFEALSALERQPYDVILLDVHMPRLDGLETAREVCARWPVTERPRLIAMTADALEGDRERCLDAGMSDYVSKPVRIEELADALARSVARGFDAAAPAPTRASDANEGDVLWADDLSLLRDSVGPDAFEAIVADYVDSSPGWLTDLETAIRAGDVSQARLLAHDLKSTSKTVGARRVATIARELEERARDGSLEGAGALTVGLYEALVGARSALANR
jgi:CheY-like chemotaxis protein/HPt (histidine-containing phosphotransfer) domain-containing protein